MPSEWKRQVTQNFESRAAAYDQHSAVQNKVADSLIKDMPDLETPDVLEIGCGTGAMTRRVLDKYPGGNFEITDISQAMLEHAKAKIGQGCRVNWQVMDGENPVSEQAFDLILGNMVFQWFEDLGQSLTRLKVLLKPGGAIYYSLPAPDSFEEWHKVLKELALPAGTPDFMPPPGIYKSEAFPLHYDSTLTFLQEMKHLGAHTPRAGYAQLSPADLRKACRKADAEFGGKITWRILYGCLKT